MRTCLSAAVTALLILTVSGQVLAGDLNPAQIAQGVISTGRYRASILFWMML